MTEEATAERAFHLRELRRHLSEFSAGLARIGKGGDSESAGEDRNEVANLLVLAEHMREGHLVALGHPIWSPPRSRPRLPTGLAGLVARRAENLAVLIAEVEHLDVEEASIASSMDATVLPRLRDLQYVANTIHHRLDPLAAMGDAEDIRLATPRHRRIHAQARSLVECPTCGAPLGAGDRTRNGSFCEACRTAWRESKGK